MATAQNVIKDFTKILDSTSLKGTAALDAAVKGVSKFSSWSELTQTMVKDCKAYNGDYTGFLKDMCDIVLDNDDTGAITGSDAGSGITKTAESIVPESGSITYPSSNEFTIQGLKVTVPELDTLTDSQKFIVGALYTWWINSSLNLINDSFGMNFNEAGTTVKEMDVTFYNSADGRMAVVSYSTTQKCTELHMKINMNYYDSIDTSDPNGSGGTSALNYLDRTIAHEMVHAVMAANYDYYNDYPVVFKEGSAELVHGIDDKRRDRIQNLASNSTSLQTAFSGSGTNTYAAGYMVLRYLAKQAAAGRDPSTEVNPDSSSDSSSTTDTSTSTTTDTSTTTTQSTIDGGSATFSSDSKTLTVKGDFTEDIWLGERNLIKDRVSDYANANTLTIDAAQLTGSIILAGNSNDNTITAGSNGTSVWGGSGGNDILIGGDSRDMFWYSKGGGNDEVRNFTTGTSDNSDVLTIMDGFNVNRAGNDLAIISEDGGTMSVALDSSNINDSVQYTNTGRNPIGVKIGNTNSGNNFTYDKNSYYLGGNNEDTLSIYDSAGRSTVFLTDGHFININAINAANSTAQNVLAGNHLDNRIIAGSNNTSMWGGESGSNDVMTGGNGADMFWYGLGEGNDVIDNANGADSVNLYNINLGDIASFEDFQSGVKLNFSAGSLTINGADTPKVMLADGSSYKYDRNSATWTN